MSGVANDYSVVRSTSSSASFAVTVPWAYDTGTLIVKCKRVSSGAETTLVKDAGYTEGSGIITVTNPYGAGVAVTITVYRQTVPVQTYELAEQPMLSPASLQLALDRAIRLIQELRGYITASGVVSLDGFTVPNIVARAGKVLGFNVTTGAPEMVDVVSDAALADEIAAREAADSALSALAPTAGQKAALAGTSGTPGAGNTYVTNADTRNSNARTPTAHASSHGTGQSDAITPSAIGAEAAGTAATAIGIHAALTDVHGLGNKADKTGTADIEITDATKGVILRTAGGRRARLTLIENDGVLTIGVTEL